VPILRGKNERTYYQKHLFKRIYDVDVEVKNRFYEGKRVPEDGWLQAWHLALEGDQSSAGFDVSDGVHVFCIQLEIECAEVFLEVRLLGCFWDDGEP